MMSGKGLWVRSVLLGVATTAAGWGHAQTTRVSGKVTDASTGETLPFVNIAFVDSRIGTTTDIEGNYAIDTYYATDSLRVSSVGYISRTLSVRKDRAQVLDITLEPNKVQLAEVVIRPPDRKRCAWTADLLLRSGVFALVVIDGAPPLSRVHGVRLAQLARERDAACVVLEHHDGGREVRPSRLAGTVRLRIAAMPPCAPSLPPSMRLLSTRRRPTRSREPVAGELIAQQAIAGPSPTVADASRRFVVTVEKGGNSQGRSPSIEVNSAVVVARRVCANSEIPDRRGVARSARRPWTARGNSSDAEQPGQHTEHPVTWGGLGVSASDLYGVDLPGHPARLTAGFTDGAITLSNDRPFPPRERSDRETDQRTRDWTRHRGRRRAADPSYGRRPKRDLSRLPV